MYGTSPSCFLRWDWCFSAAKTRDFVNSSMNVNILILIKEVSIYNLIKRVELGSLLFKVIRRNFMTIRAQPLSMAAY